MSRIIAFTRRSCAGFLNDQRKQTAIASTPWRDEAPDRGLGLGFVRAAPPPRRSSRRAPTRPRSGAWERSATGFWLEGKCTTLADVARGHAARAAHDVDRVLVAAGGDQPDPGALPLDERIGADRGPVREHRDVAAELARRRRPRRSAATRIAASMPSAKSRGVEEALVAVMRPARSSTTQSVNVPPISTPTRRLATLYFSASNSKASCEIGVHLHAGLRRLDVAADHVQALADDGARQSVARHRHRRQYRPSVARRIVRFQRAERVHHLAVLALATRDIDAPAVDAGRHRAARRGHLRASCPRRRWPGHIPRRRRRCCCRR